MMSAFRYFIAMNDLLFLSGLLDADELGNKGLEPQSVDIAEYGAFFRVTPTAKPSNRLQPYCEMY
jgi:hypothetical protein